jgi:hypothetical protein
MPDQVARSLLSCAVATRLVETLPTAAPAAER